jgi:hypothetical protein
VYRTVLAALVLIAGVVAGCSGPAVSPSAEASSQPSAEPAAEAPQPTLAPDEVEEKFSQRIERAYCVGKHKAAWCPYVRRDPVTENYRFLVYGPSVGVLTKLTDQKKDRRLAAELCDDLVAVESSDVITTFGLQRFSVYGRHGSKAIATCDMPR